MNYSIVMLPLCLTVFYLTVFHKGSMSNCYRRIFFTSTLVQKNLEYTKLINVTITTKPRSISARGHIWSVRIYKIENISIQKPYKTLKRKVYFPMRMVVTSVLNSLHFSIARKTVKEYAQNTPAVNAVIAAISARKQNVIR